jgi:uncharacterized Fe-S cluster-containing radical SAM superfamily protein
MIKQINAGLHPMIGHLKGRIESLLSLIQLEKNGDPFEPDGFRIRDPGIWAFEPYGSVFESLGALSGYCNLRCNFCYEKGNPLPYEKTRLSPAEAETRIRYFRSGAKRGLPQFRRRIYKEPFTNADLIRILERIRAADPAVEISLTTNGALLTEDILEQLKRLIPVNLSISVNSADPSLRRGIMGDRQSRRTLKLVEKIPDHGIAFNGSIVAWPTLDASDLAATVRFLDHHQARMIRATLPGYSKYYSQTPPFDTRQAWNAIIDALLPLREKIAAPLLLLPSLYHAPAFIPRIEGVIPASPAREAGLRAGDVIRRIDEKPVFFRSEAKEILGRSSKASSLSVALEREGKPIAATIQDKGEIRYPYRPAGYPSSTSYPFGIVLIDDFDPKWLWEALTIIDQSPARKILLMTSQMMEPWVAQLLDTYPQADEILAEKHLYLWIPRHRFWGGNIIMGDLYTCSDYLHAVDDFMAETEIRPELILLPSSFTHNNMSDLLGVPYSSIESATQIPVALVPCHHITL